MKNIQDKIVKYINFFVMLLTTVFSVMYTTQMSCAEMQQFSQSKEEMTLAKKSEPLTEVDEKLRSTEEDVHVGPYVYSADNIAGIERIINSHIFINGKKFLYTQLIDIEPKELLEIYGPDDMEYTQRFMAKSGNKLVGFVYVSPYDPEHPEAFDEEFKGWLVSKLAVAPEARRLGVGKKLFDFIAEWVKKRAASKGKTAEYLYIECDAFNKPACDAYRKWTNNNCVDIEEEDPEDNYTLCKKYLIEVS